MQDGTASAQRGCCTMRQICSNGRAPGTPGPLISHPAAMARDLIGNPHMADVLSILTTPFFDLVDLALESPLSVVVALVLVGVAVLVLVV